MARFLLSLCLVILFSVQFIYCDELLKITAPANLAQQFSYNGVQGSIPESPALFGIPSYQKQIQGIVLTLPDQTNLGPHGEQYGCDPYDFSNGKNSLWYQKREDPNYKVNLILLVERGGGCTFVTKVRNAQYAGAASVIVFDNNPAAFSIPFMAADATAETVKIPSMMIRYVDGIKLKSAIESNWTAPDYEPVRASLTYFLPRPDDRVETDFWSISRDAVSDEFKRTIGSAMRYLGDHVLFTPHFFTLDGRVYNCQYNNRCSTQCFNGGKYCSPDPEGSFTKGWDGNDIILENAREIVLWRALNNTGQNARMFDYWEQFYSQCDTVDKWKNGCGLKIIDGLELAQGINSAYIQNTITAAGGLEYPGTYKSNTILDEELALQNAKGIFQLPQLYTNNVPYLGDIRCAPPITQSKCGLLQQICAGYADGTTPTACSTDPNCPFGQGCEGAEQRGSNKGATIGAVIGIVIAFAVLVGGLVFWYMRRQQKQVKEDIDVLLKQYLPLDENVPTQTHNTGFSSSNSSRPARSGGFVPVRNETNIDPEEDI